MLVYLLQYDTVFICCNMIQWMNVAFINYYMNTCIDPGAITDFSGGYTPCLAGQSEEMGKSLGHSEEKG